MMSRAYTPILHASSTARSIKLASNAVMNVDTALLFTAFLNAKSCTLLHHVDFAPPSHHMTSATTLM